MPGFFTRVYNAAFEQVSNAALVYLRILIGIIMCAEGVHSLSSGWVKQVYIDTHFTFTFIGFEWLNFLHGPVMYGYYAAISVLGILVCIGLWYRAATVLLALMWTSVYLLQKTHYNNHFYLMVLLCWLMILVPAHKRFSLDTKRGAVTESNTCPKWCLFIFQFQVTCVFVYAAIAKIYPDWLRAIPLKLWLNGRGDMPVIGKLLTLPYTPYIIAYMGILFDLLIVPALLWKRSRKIAFIAALIFNAFNSVVFSIGTFPFLALGLGLIFYPASFFEDFMPDASQSTQAPDNPKKSKLAFAFLAVYMVIQIALPLRHHFIPGNVLWTEEGHRLSWRMMLRNKTGDLKFIVTNKHTGETWNENIEAHLSEEQISRLAGYPDMCWQYAQYLKKHYNAKGMDVKVQVNGVAIVNGRPPARFIDSTVDLAAEQWNVFGSNKWITSYPY